ncbi:hypothetical protein PSH97_21795 [Pseudomonas cucumis]|uniref:Uncharacterized protein n=1 Tax=Pseudomonas cucumis TaxID=2954082 RepID=A0ABY9EU13_9PSED|nr:hypothetical protein [Pseudomonas cucumis]WLG83708.1 hypothetical protein PSH97_21795 [Pseudomonas cucumis]
MTKPQFGVSFTPGETEDDESTATITITYVADLDHRYLLNISPSWATSSGLDIDLGSDGQLISINSSNTSNVTAVVQTVAKLASAAAMVGALDLNNEPYSSLADRVEKQNQIAVTSSPPNSCLRGAEYRSKFVGLTDLEERQKGVRSALVNRLRLANDLPETAGLLHYMNDEEFRLLKAVRCSLEEEWFDERAARMTKTDDELDKLTPGNKDGTRIIDLVRSATDPKMPLNSRIASLSRLRQLEKISAWKSEISPVLVATSNFASYEPSSVLKLTKALVDMSPEEWRQRRLLTIQREVQAREWEVAQLGCGVPSVVTKSLGKSATECRRALGALSVAREDFAANLGRLTDYRLASKFGSQLASKATSSNEIDPKAYERLRVARNAALTDVDSAKSALLNGPPHPQPIQVNKDVVKMLNATGQTEADGSWVLDKVVTELPEDGTDIPEIVIVIDKGK